MFMLNLHLFSRVPFHNSSVKNLEQIFTGQRKSYISALWSFHTPLVQIKLHLLSTVLLSGFQSSPELWNPLSKAVLGKFHGSGGHSKCNCYKTDPIFTDMANCPKF